MKQTLPSLTLAVTAAVLLTMTASMSRAATPLALFGTPLKGATRAELQGTLLKSGFTPVRVDAHYFCDLYDAHGQIKGASKLQVCYTAGHDRFAYAEYTFRAFMDTQLVQRVIDMVRIKYGPPSAMHGDVDLGNVTAHWHESQGMEVRVARGWPDTTTYLDLVDTKNERRMEAQMQAVQAAHRKRQVQKDSNAF